MIPGPGAKIPYALWHGQNIYICIYIYIYIYIYINTYIQTENNKRGNGLLGNTNINMGDYNRTG